MRMRNVLYAIVLRPRISNAMAGAVYGSGGGVGGPTIVLSICLHVSVDGGRGMLINTMR